jgi:hypothetical protein
VIVTVVFGTTVTLAVPEVCPVGVVAGGVPLPPDGGAVDGGAVAPTLAVMFAVCDVVNDTDATPSLFVVAAVLERLPASVENETSVLGNALPFKSKTVATIKLVPPEGMVAGDGFTTTRPTAAVPTAILTAPLVPVVAAPEEAVIVALPLRPLPLKSTIARPLMSVSTSDGSTTPSVVVKITCVPGCGGVPAGSSSCAISWAVPLAEIALVEDVRMIVEPDGARSGTLSHAAVSREAATTPITAVRRGVCRRANVGNGERVIIKTLTILIS